MALPNENYEKIVDRQALANYVRQLVDDFQSNPDKWENKNLSDYLLAMAAWIEDMDGYYKNKGTVIPTSPSWAMLAEILTASSIYE